MLAIPERASESMNLKRPLSFITLALILVACGAANAAEKALAPAQVEQAFSLAARFLHQPALLPETQNETIVTASTFKAWPGKEPYLLAAFVYAEERKVERHLLLALLDLQHDKVIATYQGMVEDDAIAQYAQGDLSFDTPPYLLSPVQRAFGLDVRGHSPPHADAGINVVRTLFVREGAVIRPVLDYFITSHWSRKNDEEDIVKYKISIAPTTSHGYADLVVTTIYNDSKWGRTTQVLRYDGTRYPRAVQ